MRVFQRPQMPSANQTYSNLFRAFLKLKQRLFNTFHPRKIFNFRSITATSPRTVTVILSIFGTKYAFHERISAGLPSRLPDSAGVALFAVERKHPATHPNCRVSDWFRISAWR
jgi:hypothetical protein